MALNRPLGSFEMVDIGTSKTQFLAAMYLLVYLAGVCFVVMSLKTSLLSVA